MARQAIKYLYEYGPPVVVAPPGGAPLNAVGEVEDGNPSRGGAPVVVVPPAVVQKPAGGADLGHGVWYLQPTVGIATTPDAPDLTLIGNVRFKARFRDDSVESSTSRMLASKQTPNSSAIAWRFVQVYTTTSLFTGYPSGTPSPQISVHSVGRTTSGQTPPGNDVYLGATLTGVAPGVQTASLRNQWLTSNDGVTWTALGSQGAAVRGDAISSAAVAPLSIGQTWQGRIYWAQMEAINRAQLVFPGVTGNFLAVTPETLSLPGDVEVVARIAVSQTGATYGHIVGSDGSPRGWQINIQTTRQVRFTYPMPATYYVTSAVIPQTTGMVWIRCRRTAATGVHTVDWAPDSPVEPTVWTSLTTTPTGTPVPGGIAAMTGAQTYIGARTTGGINDHFGGRIARVVVRNGFAGTPVLDLIENNAGVMATASTFVASTGQTVTVNQTTGNTIVQPQADRVVWRFDAEDAAALTGKKSFVFPGVTGNYMSFPDAADLDLTGDVEMVARFAYPSAWATGNVGVLVGKGTNYEFRVMTGGLLSLACLTTPTNTFSGVNSTAVATFTPGTMYWAKATRVASTGLVSFYWAADQPTEPTTWTAAGTATFRAGEPMVANALVGSIAERSGAYTFNGRIARAIVRSGVAGPTVFDLNESNAEQMLTATTFQATTGQTVTVNQTSGNTIVQPAKTYTDPRGRQWTVADPNAIGFE